MSDLAFAVDAVHGIDGLTPEHGRLFVVVGVFDGLHRGHLYLLHHLRLEARRRGARPAVITFDHHPDEIVLGSAPPLLCDPDERLARLAGAGVAVTIVQHFDVALRMTAYDRFIEMVRARVELAGFLMTPDAAFGHERRGTPAAVAGVGRRDGFEVVVVPPLNLDGRPVRSADIRAAVSNGDLGAVRHLLGRALAVVGERIDDGRGRPEVRATEANVIRLSFPVPMALPSPGRYAVRMEPAWTPDGPPPPEERTIVGGSAVVDNDCLVLRAHRMLPVADRIRVMFVRRLA